MYSATLTLLYCPLHWKVEENKLSLDSPASCWMGEGVVWLATYHQSLMSPLPKNLGDQLGWLQYTFSTFIN